METTHVIFPPKLRFKTLRFFMSSKCAADSHTHTPALRIRKKWGNCSMETAAGICSTTTAQTVKNCQSRKRMVPSSCIACSALELLLSAIRHGLSCSGYVQDWLRVVTKKQSTCFPLYPPSPLSKSFLYIASHFPRKFLCELIILDIRRIILHNNHHHHLHNSDILLCLLQTPAKLSCCGRVSNPSGY